jgi:hypothetical protein
MRFGQDAIAFLKPEDEGGLMEAGGGEETEGGNEEAMVVYDHVDDNKNKNFTDVKV